MPLRQYFRAARILKAKRSKRLRGRPAWQDTVPKEREARDAYSIAARYESTFARAFLSVVRSLITPEIERDFRKAWKSGSPAAMVNSIPYFEENPDAKVWQDFTDRLSVAYLTVIQAAGDAATRDLNKQLKTDLKFTALPPEPETEEVVEKSMEDVRAAARGMTVDVNPYSLRWVEEHGLELVTQSITGQQKKIITSIIEQAMAAGRRPTDILAEIKANIGLTERDYGATLKRKQLHLDAGLSPERAEVLTSKYREKLLTGRAKMIARTETIKAQAQGRLDAWKVAQESGDLPAVQRRWIAAPPSPNPYRPCEICTGLDNTTAKLDESYESIAGPIMAPPAHVACRCSESLERVKTEG